MFILVSFWSLYSALLVTDKLDSHRISSDTCCVTLPPCIVFSPRPPSSVFLKDGGVKLAKGGVNKKDDRFVKYSRKKSESNQHMTNRHA